MVDSATQCERNESVLESGYRHLEYDEQALYKHDGNTSEAEGKKRKRRTHKELDRCFVCEVATCQRPYASEHSLNQHMRLKHAVQTVPTRTRSSMMILRPGMVSVAGLPVTPRHQMTERPYPHHYQRRSHKFDSYIPAAWPSISRCSTEPNQQTTSYPIQYRSDVHIPLHQIDRHGQFFGNGQSSSLTHNEICKSRMGVPYSQQIRPRWWRHSIDVGAVQDIDPRVIVNTDDMPWSQITDVNKDPNMFSPVRSSLQDEQESVCDMSSRRTPQVGTQLRSFCEPEAVQGGSLNLSSVNFVSVSVGMQEDEHACPPVPERKLDSMMEWQKPILGVMDSDQSTRDRSLESAISPVYIDASVGVNSLNVSTVPPLTMDSSTMNFVLPSHVKS
eukprot:CFRG3235T1